MKKKVTVIITIILSVVLLATALVLYHINKESEYAYAIGFENGTQLLGLIYLGGTEGSYDYSVVDKYYTKEEQEQFVFAEFSGEELYLIIPRYETETYLNELEMGENGEVREIKGMMSIPPFFVKCNASDIFSNAEISFNYKGKEYVYSPYISLKDGSVVTEDFVYLIEE